MYALDAIFLVGLGAIVSASDYPCTRIGGTCTDYQKTTCIAGYRQKLCDGNNERRCCLKCNAACKNKETIDSKKDGKCNGEGGDCFHNTNYCDGSYNSGKCGGSFKRQCCIGDDDSTGSNANAGCYGDIMDVETTGASKATAKQDKLSGGVASSHTMAETDAKEMEKYKALIIKAASTKCVDPSIIAAIMSRESRAGSLLDKNGLGDNGNGFGLMQVDKRYHNIEGTPHSLTHILQATGILIASIKGVAAKHPTWTQTQQLKGGISAYNAGVGNVRTYENMDGGTTGDDYGNDVSARAQYYKEHGY